MSRPASPLPPLKTGLDLMIIAVIALNLRPFLAGPGPMAAEIMADTGLSPAGFAGLSLLPLALMGLGALATPALQRRFGMRAAILWGLGTLAAGSVARLVPLGAPALLGTAALCGAGVAVLQTMAPAFIRTAFPHRFSAAMGFYSALLLAGGAIGARAVPLISGQAGSWRTGLGAMALPALGALLLALLALPAQPSAASGARLSLLPGLRNRRIWRLILVFGLLNMSYGTLIAWFAPFLATRGLSPDETGALLAWMSVVQALAALALPLLRSRKGDCRPVLFLAILCQTAGFCSLLATAPWPLASAIVLGVGLGGTFSVILVIMVDHARTPADAILISALVQGGGFLLTALSPVLAAMIVSRQGYPMLWAFHLAVLVVAGLLSLKFAPRSQVEGISAASDRGREGAKA